VLSLPGGMRSNHSRSSGFRFGDKVMRSVAMTDASSPVHPEGKGVATVMSETQDKFGGVAQRLLSKLLVTAREAEASSN
jgi:hypothetical protein